MIILNSVATLLMIGVTDGQPGDRTKSMNALLSAGSCTVAAQHIAAHLKFRRISGLPFHNGEAAGTAALCSTCRPSSGAALLVLRL